MAARAARGLVFAVGIQQARFEDALEWGRHGEAALARNGHDPESEAALVSNVGSVFGERGDITTRRHDSRALEVFERLPERPQYTEAILRRNLARAYHGAERWEEAAAAFEDTRPYVVAAFGPDSRETQGVDESIQEVAERR